MAETPFPRRLRHLLEYLLARALFALFGALSLDRASDLGGCLGRNVGPRLSISERARRNLRRAFPDLDADGIEGIVRGMWDNLGRVIAEYPHLSEFRLYDGDGRVEVIGAEYVDHLRDDGVAGIFFAAHLGNWELHSLGATQRGVPLIHIYRAANNPYVDRLIGRFREAIGGTYHPKSAAAARELLGAIKRGEHLGMLVDQKYNEGIPVPFFGREAMTASALAEFAFRFNIPIVPARVERIHGARFRVTILAPMELAETGDRAADVGAAMRRVNALFEDWIRERPEQWLWLHRRWPKED